MSQFGMNMPGGQGRRVSTMNVYTGLLFVAVLSLAVACVYVWIGASKIGVNGNAFEIQNPAKEIRLSK
jgi:hypothetical protein